MNLPDIYAIYIQEHSVIKSTYQSLLSFVLLAFSIYISQGSTFWTFITGIMFIGFIAARSASLVYRSKRSFKTKAELLAWVNQLPED